MTEMTSLHPIYQHRGRMALSKIARKTDPTLHDAESRKPNLPQSINHIPKHYGSHQKAEIMAHDAFYAMTELFEFSAASIDQLLEMLEGKLRAASHTSDTTNLSVLLIAKDLIDDYRHYVKDTLEIVCARGGPRWPRVTGHKQIEKVHRAANRLESRYQQLLRRCERLSEHCASTVTILMTEASQRQTQTTIEQTNRISRLSILAYIFIPLTFASGFYGMNFKEFGDELSIWTFFAMAVPLLTVALSAYFIDVQSARGFCWRYLSRLQLSTR